LPGLERHCPQNGVVAARSISAGPQYNTVAADALGIFSLLAPEFSRMVRARFEERWIRIRVRIKLKIRIRISQG
jgi:hypothetical protein